MTTPGATVLVVGGAGVFGSRLVERLAHSSNCTILVAGRSMSKAMLAIAKICAHQPRAILRPWVLDRQRITADELRATGATIVVDAAGPFQGQEPRLARVAIAASC